MKSNAVKVADLVEDGNVLLLFEYPVGEERAKSVELTYMTGSAEEAFSKDRVTKSIGKMVTELLAGVTTTVGGRTLSEGNRKEFIRNLYTVDRDLMLLASYATSFGDSITFDTNCPHCNKAHSITGNISELEVELPNTENPVHTIEVPLFHGIKYAEELHKVVTVARSTGHVQESVTTQELMKNPVIMKNALLIRIIKKLGTLPTIPPHIISDLMSVKDKTIILKATNEFDGRVNSHFDVVCTDCDKDFQAQIPMEKYFTGE